MGLQNCAEEGVSPGLSGVELWDVSEPRLPQQLAFFDVGVPLRGVHELYLMRRGDRAFALLAVPYSEVSPPDHLGDFRIVEVTDPRHPVQVANWGAGKDAGLAFGSPTFMDLGAPYDCTPPAGAEPLCRGRSPGVFLHSVSANESGTRAYLSYWDAGMIIMDISDPAQPLFVGRGAEPSGDEGNVHSAIAVPGERWAVTTDEDFSPLETPSPPAEDTWGRARIWDISDPTRPLQVAAFATPRSLTNGNTGVFTAHNPVVRGNLLYLSWYGDGLRVVDITRPEAPHEVASWRGYFWGVHVQEDLIFLSGTFSGLHILRQTD